MSINPRQQPLGNARFVLAGDKRAGEENVSSANASIVRVTEDWLWEAVTTTGGVAVFAGPCRIGRIINTSGSAATVAVYDNDSSATNAILTGLGISDNVVFEGLLGMRCDTGLYINTNQALLVGYSPMVQD